MLVITNKLDKNNLTFFPKKSRHFFHKNSKDFSIVFYCFKYNKLSDEEIRWF